MMQLAPKKLPKLKRKGSSSSHQFSGAFAVSFREGIFTLDLCNANCDSNATPPTRIIKIHMVNGKSLMFYIHTYTR